MIPREMVDAVYEAGVLGEEAADVEGILAAGLHALVVLAQDGEDFVSGHDLEVRIGARVREAVGQ